MYQAVFNLTILGGIDTLAGEAAVVEMFSTSFVNEDPF